MSYKIKEFRLHLLAWLVIPVILFVVSCEYDPDGKYVKVVQEMGPVPVTAKIDDKDSVICIWKRSDLNYSISPGTIEVENIDVFLNNQKWGSYSTNTGIITLDPYQLNDGNYPLRMEIYVRSGSGSLADKIGGELYLWKKDFTLNIDRSISQISQITDVKIENGQLRIDWEKYPKENFEKYILDDPIFGNPIEISNINQTYYYDGNYIGGDFFYFFRVLAAGNSTENQFYRFSFPFPHLLEFKTEANYSFTLKWSKCLFYSNFSEYKVNLTGYSEDNIELISTTDINDTVANTDKFPFGEKFYFSITTKSKNQKIGYSSTESAFVGETSFPYFSGAASCPYPCDEIYFSYGSNELYRYSPVDLSIVEKLPQNHYIFRFTANKKYLLVQYMSNGKLILYSVPQFEEVGSLLYNHLLIDYDISESGKAVILQEDSLEVYDYILKQKQSISIPNTDYSQFRIYISSDGKCIYLDDPDWKDKIYQVNNNQIIQAGISTYSKFYGFNPFDENEFITFSDNHLDFYDCNTLSKKRSIDIPAFPSSNIDPVSGYFMAEESKLTEKYSVFGIFDIKTGLKVGQLRATTTPQGQYGKPLLYLFCDGIIYSPNGYKLKTIE